MIATSGKYNSLFANHVSRDKISSRFGKPILREQLDSPYYGATYKEEYKVYGKVGRQMLDYEHYGMLIGCTFGLAEVVLLPIAVRNATEDIFSWQIVTVYYDEEGKYRWHFVQRIEDVDCEI